MAAKLVLLVALMVVPSMAALEQEDGPVVKVVKLLTALRTSLNADETAEQGAYDKFACWCETTTAKKATAIASANTQLRKLGQQILTLKGTVAIRTDEVAAQQKLIEQNNEAQATATSNRAKENGAHQAESAEKSQAMAGINKAIGVLTAATKQPAFMQVDMSAQLSASVSAVVDVAPMDVLAALSPEKISQLRNFAKPSLSLAQVDSKTVGAPQSMTIQGIMADMYTTMAVDSMDATALEATRNRAFESYMSTKDGELTTATGIRLKKNTEQAEASEQLAEANEAFDATSKQLAADVEFDGITKKDCTAKTAEWNLRQKLRKEETAGITSALNFLDSAAAKALFAKAIKPGMEASFLQLDATSNKEMRSNLDKLYKKLKASATKSHSLRLAALAAHVRMAKAGHFTAVIKSIDTLVNVLSAEQASDLKKRDGCVDQYQQIAQASNKLNWQIKKNKAQVQKLENTISFAQADADSDAAGLTEKKGQAVKEIAAATTTIADMKQTRKDGNTAFVSAKANDVAAIKLLKQALAAMSKFYKDNKIDVGAALAQTTQSVEQKPHADFSSAGSRGGQSSSIVSFLTMIIEDLEAEVKNGVAGERTAQMTFVSAMAAATKLKTELEAKKQSFTDSLAKRGKEKIAELADQSSNQGDLDGQNNLKSGLKTDCDYMISKYTERAKYRTAEAEALNEAKNFLSQQQEALVQTTALVQSSHSATSFTGISFSHLD